MKQVPLRRCKKCPHFKHQVCVLQDLEPCTFKEKDSNKAANIFLVCCTLIALAVCIFAWYYGGR